MNRTWLLIRILLISLVCVMAPYAYANAGGAGLLGPIMALVGFSTSIFADVTELMEKLDGKG
ncbi:TMhelix containing protein [Vibrio phage 1.081.O._10N.286.52.C2]|nr:TMhelix containing protein [Vibrio phage 1.081.O._10N.286.52.C2]